MKADLNNESRRKFEALYFGQNVFWTCRVPMEKENILDGRKLARPFSKYDKIELKPLCQISDEDLITLNLKAGNYTEYAEKGCFILDESDYLRSKGYALPWMGLSVEEMVDAGWIKLIYQ